MFPCDTQILLAEDTAITRGIVHKMLYKIGFTQVKEAADGTEAKREIERGLEIGKPVGLIISDWNMPGLSGLQLLKRVRSEPRLALTPFILLTSNNEKDQVLEAIRSGVTTYLTKPFPIEVLEKKIRQAWESTQRRKVV
jgi:two-component system chemotaxis response regulator CheY